MKRILTLCLVLFSVAGARAQYDFSDPKFAKFGATPEERQENMLTYNFFNDAYRNKDFDAAAGYFAYLVNRIPRVSVNLYIYGASIYKNKIARTTDPARRNELVDSLMFVYDKRIEHFPEYNKSGDPYELKAKEYLIYRPDDYAGIHRIFSDVIERRGREIDRGFVVIYFNELAEEYKAGNIEVDQLFTEYNRLLPLFDDYADQGEDFRSQFEAILANSGAASGEKLEEIFAPRIAADSTNIELLERVVGLLWRENCHNAFATSVVEKLHAVKPDSRTAMYLADRFQERENYGKALRYLEDAIGREESAEQKSSLYNRIASIDLLTNHYGDAATAARTARDLNPENGLPYLILGQAYAASAAGCSGMDKSAVYWAAYDMVSQARAKFAEDPSQADQVDTATRLMSAYRGGFPSAEDGFFYELREGQPYTVKCGLPSGTRTTVRFR